MKYGLSEAQLKKIVSFLARFSAIESAAIFGSRAIGNFKNASDVDIVLMGEKIDSRLSAHIQYELHEETYLPYFFDIISYNDIDNDALKKHIAEYGQVIYKK